MALVGKKMVEQMIKSKALVVISKSYCPFCHKVRGVVKKNNGLFTVRLTVRGGRGGSALLALTISKCENFGPI